MAVDNNFWLAEMLSLDMYLKHFLLQTSLLVCFPFHCPIDYKYAPVTDTSFWLAEMLSLDIYLKHILLQI